MYLWCYFLVEYCRLYLWCYFLVEYCRLYLWCYFVVEYCRPKCHLISSYCNTVRRGAQFNIQRLLFEVEHAVDTLEEAKKALQKIIKKGSKPKLQK